MIRYQRFLVVLMLNFDTDTSKFKASSTVYCDTISLPKWFSTIMHSGVDKGGGAQPPQ